MLLAQRLRHPPWSASFADMLKTMFADCVRRSLKAIESPCFGARRVSTTLRQVLTKFSEFFIFQEEISFQDRLGTTIGDSVDPQHPRFWHFSSAFPFSKVDRCRHRIASKELVALYCLRCCVIGLLPEAAVPELQQAC